MLLPGIAKFYTVKTSLQDDISMVSLFGLKLILMMVLKWESHQMNNQQF